jgi:uncharacterized repeat protein (TIGR01451 family)
MIALAMPLATEADSTFGRIVRGLLAGLGFVGLALVASPAWAQTVSLGTAGTFGVLGGSAVNNTGPSIITGDLGVSPGLVIAGFPPGTVTGTIYIGGGVASGAQSDVTTAYNDLAGRAFLADLSGTDLGGQTLTPGVYNFSAAAALTGILRLDAQGDPNAVFIFQIGTTLTTASSSLVLVINSGQACNVFWQVGTSATLGSSTAFAGSILALASITMGTGASTSGRLLARNGAVTLDGNAVSVCSLAPPPSLPALGKAFSPATVNAGGVSTLTVTLSNASAAVATLTAPLIDTLPSGVVIAPTPNVGSTCGGAGAPVGVAGSSTVTLPAGRSIAANSSCTLTVDVTAALGGSYINSLLAGALVTTNGNNTGPAIATLTVIAPVAIGSPAEPIPTLSEWAMIVLAALVAIAGFAAMRRYAR